jgi:VWFA-related protein
MMMSIAQQIVRRERRKRVAHHKWSGDVSLKSCRRVKSNVRRFHLLRIEHAHPIIFLFVVLMSPNLGSLAQPNSDASLDLIRHKPHGPYRKSTQLSLFVLVAILFAVTASATNSQDPIPGRQVKLTVTITDKTRRYIGGLGKDQVTVLDERIPQELILFQEENNVPASIGFVLDVSRLKFGNLLSGSTEQVRQFMAASGQANEYCVVAFNNKPYIATDFTRDHNQIISAFATVSKANSSTKTALYDALRVSIEKVKAGTNPKHVILLISDDRDNGSNLKRSELIDIIKDSDVLLYSIRVTTPGSNTLDSNVLDELCSTTGGLAFYPTTAADFQDVFEIIALELQHQYSAVFHPTGIAKDVEWHHLEFNVKPLQLKEKKKLPLFARSREGYYLRP